MTHRVHREHEYEDSSTMHELALVGPSNARMDTLGMAVVRIQAFQRGHAVRTMTRRSAKRRSSVAIHLDDTLHLQTVRNVTAKTAFAARGQMSLLHAVLRGRGRVFLRRNEIKFAII